MRAVPLNIGFLHQTSLKHQITKMPSQLCQTCATIPPHFWSEDLDGKGFPWGPYVKLQPYRSMEAAAAAGCPLCRILIHSAQTNFLDEKTLENVPVTLSRAIMDSHQGVCLAVGGDDISHTTFFRVPELWSKSARFFPAWKLWICASDRRNGRSD
jgi:hypothetical protein